MDGHIRLLLSFLSDLRSFCYMFGHFVLAILRVCKNLFFFLVIVASSLHRATRHTHTLTQIQSF